MEASVNEVANELVDNDKAKVEAQEETEGQKGASEMRTKRRAKKKAAKPKLHLRPSLLVASMKWRL